MRFGPRFAGVGLAILLVPVAIPLPGCDRGGNDAATGNTSSPPPGTAGRKVEHTIERAGDAVENGIDKFGQVAGNATTQSAEILRDARQTIHQATAPPPNPAPITTSPATAPTTAPVNTPG